MTEEELIKFRTLILEYTAAFIGGENTAASFNNVENFVNAMLAKREGE